jgi:hypothetical protein
MENVDIGGQIFWRPKPGDLFDQLHRAADQDRQFKWPTGPAMVINVPLDQPLQD